MRLTEQGKRRAVPLAVAESLGQRKRPLRQRKRPVGLLHPERRSRQPEQRFELFAPLEVREELAELFRPALEVFQLDQSEPRRRRMRRRWRSSASPTSSRASV